MRLTLLPVFALILPLMDEWLQPDPTAIGSNATSSSVVESQPHGGALDDLCLECFCPDPSQGKVYICDGPAPGITTSVTITNNTGAGMNFTPHDSAVSQLQSGNVCVKPAGSNTWGQVQAGASCELIDLNCNC